MVEKKIKIILSVQTQYRLVTDRQTDGQTPRYAERRAGKSKPQILNKSVRSDLFWKIYDRRRFQLIENFQPVCPSRFWSSTSNDCKHAARETTQNIRYQSFNHSVIQSIDQSIDRSINRSMIINQSTTEADAGTQANATMSVSYVAWIETSESTYSDFRFGFGFGFDQFCFILTILTS